MGRPATRDTPMASRPGRGRWSLRRPCVCALACALLFLLVFNRLLSLSLISDGDDYTQHYPAFLYIGRWWRAAAKALFVGHRMPPTWDFSIGYGSDAVLTLGYYGMFDWSTAAFAIFSTPQNGEALYTAMVAARTALVAAAFLAYCREMGCGERGSCVACLAYVFCPFALSVALVEHHFFALPMLYAPLLLVGAERILEGEAPLWLAPAVALSAAGSYYFCYMELVVALAYLLVRMRLGGGGLSARECARRVAVAAVLVAAGLLLAMPAVLPQAMSLLGDVRAGAQNAVGLLYPPGAYARALGSLVTSQGFSYYSLVGMSPCVLLGVLAMLGDRGLAWLRVMWLTLLASTLLPVAG